MDPWSYKDPDCNYGFLLFRFVMFCDPEGATDGSHLTKCTKLRGEHVCLDVTSNQTISNINYIQCNRLWNPIFACLRIPPTEEIADRLALTSDEFHKFFAVAVVFVVYHSCRNKKNLPIMTSKPQFLPSLSG